MAEIEITLPTVQYGNVKIRATPEELGVNDISDSYGLGVATAVYLNLFQQGFKHGATMDVSVSDRVATPEKAASQPSTAPQGAAQSEVDRVIDETVKAAQILAEGLGGATEVADDAAPWDKPAAAAPAKPWENMDAAPGPALDDVW